MYQLIIFHFLHEILKLVTSQLAQNAKCLRPDDPQDLEFNIAEMMIFFKKMFWLMSVNTSSLPSLT